jgi:putative phage-type endonuclease
MGLSPWKTPFQLWEEKLGMQPEPEMNYAMQRGHDLEPFARQAYIDYTGIHIDPDVVFHPAISYMMASLDGISKDRSIIVEIKCPGNKDHELAKSGKVPEKYYAQLQHQLEVTGLNLVHYFSFRNGDHELIEIQRDNEFIQEMLKKEETFWNFMKTTSSPPLTDKDYVEREDEEWKSAAKRWAAINADLTMLKEKEKEQRELLIQMSDNKSTYGAGVKLRKVTRKGSLDFNRLPILSEMDLDKFRKPPSESWRLTEIK